jgi:hypothetical protein
MNEKAGPKKSKDMIEELKKKQSELEYDLKKIQKAKKKKEKEKKTIKFTGSEEEISALYDISLDKNKLFEDEIEAHPIKSYVGFRRRKRYLKHFLCLVILPLFFAVSIAGLISFSEMQNISSNKTITISLLATIVLLPYAIVFLLTFIHISINYLVSDIEVNWRIFLDKNKKAIYIGSCIAMMALLACIILSIWYESDIPLLNRIVALI